MIDKSLVEEIKCSTRLYYALQKERIALNNRLEQKKNAGILITKKLSSLYDHMITLEQESEKVVIDAIKQHPIWNEFLIHVKGIGGKLAASLVAEIEDISRFPTISSLWAYAAETPCYVEAKCSNNHKLIMASTKHKNCIIYSNAAQEKCGGEIEILQIVEGKAPKKRQGWHFLFNQRLRSLSWKIGEQFMINQNPYYKKLIDKTKERYIKEGLPPGHALNRGKQVGRKRFLAHLWMAWRELEGLETRVPYAIEQLGHKGLEDWRTAIEKMKVKTKRKVS